MGVGLPICRSIIAAYGGPIAAGNVGASGGARFSFILPRLAGQFCGAGFGNPTTD